MKRNALPNSQQKRKLLFDKKAPREQLISCGETFLREGRLSEAAELFSRALHHEGLEQLKALAVEQGDSFLYGLAAKRSERGERREDWETLGKKAMELKKFSHAMRAFRKADQPELLKAAEEAFKEVVSLDQA